MHYLNSLFGWFRHARSVNSPTMFASVILLMSIIAPSKIQGRILQKLREPAILVDASWKKELKAGIVNLQRKARYPKHAKKKPAWSCPWKCIDGNLAGQWKICNLKVVLKMKEIILENKILSAITDQLKLWQLLIKKILVFCRSCSLNL